MSKVLIARLSAIEVLDSRTPPDARGRGDPVRRVPCEGGCALGRRLDRHREAVELRDGDANRFGGLGVAKAVDHVLGPIADAVVGQGFADLGELDAAVMAADGTADKSHFGANAIVGVSMAAARGLANRTGLPLWEVLDPQEPRLPVPHFNVVNGGAHAPNSLDFQEFMLAPIGAPSLPEAVRAGAEVYTALTHGCRPRGASPPGSATRAGSPPTSPHPRTCWPPGPGHHRRRLHPRTGRNRDRAGPRLQRVLPRRRLPRRGSTALQLRPDRLLRTARRRLPDLEHRGRPGRGRLGRLAGDERRHGGADPDRRGRHLRHRPEDDRRRQGRRQCRADQGQPDRHRLPDPGGAGGVPASRVRRDDLPPVGGDPRTRSSPTWPWRQASVS